MFSVTTVECAGPMRITLFLGRAICWWKGAHVDRTKYVVADPAVMWHGCVRCGRTLMTSGWINVQTGERRWAHGWDDPEKYG